MAIDLNSYFDANPDVASSYLENNYGLSPQDFAETHYLMYGQNEQRAAPQTLDSYYTTNTDVADSFADNRYNLSPDDFASVHYDRYGKDEQRAVPGDYNQAATQSFERDYGPKPLVAPVSPPVTDGGRQPLGAADPGYSMYEKYNPMMGSRTVGGGNTQTLGTGGADYSSDLIRSLRESSAGPATSNNGIKEYTGGYQQFQMRTPEREGSSVFNPQVATRPSVGAQGIKDWSDYSSYRTSQLNAKLPFDSFDAWQAAQRAAAGVSMAAPAEEIAPFAYYNGASDGGGA